MVVVFAVIDLAIVGPHRLWHAFLLDSDIQVTPVLLSLSWLLLMNLIVLIFNLVPAFPLDGGRIARAIVWKTTGDKRKGTRAAAMAGQGFAVVLAGLGIFLLLHGSGLGGLWLIMLAFLLYQAARAALVQTAITARIEGVRVADIMDRQPVSIPSGTAVAQAIDEYFLRYGWSWFPVVDETGHFIGIARQERVQSAIDAGEGWLTVDSMLESEEGGKWWVNEDRPLTELLASESLGRLGALMAVDGEGVLQGVVTVELTSFPFFDDITLTNLFPARRQTYGRQSRGRLHGTRQSRSPIYRLSQTRAGLAQMRARRHPENRLHQHLRHRSAHGPRPHHRAPGPDSGARNHRRSHRSRPRRPIHQSGDLVSVPFNIACGRCRNCKEGKTGICLNVNPARPGAAYGYVDMGGWVGGQAEYVMVPYADFNLLKFPDRARPWPRSAI